MKLKLLTAMVAALTMTGCGAPPKPIAVSMAYNIDYNKVYKETGVRITEAWPNFDYEPLGSLVLVDYGGYVEKKVIDPYSTNINGKPEIIVEAGKDYYNPSSESSANKAAEAAKLMGADYIVNLKFTAGNVKSPNASEHVKYVMVTGMAVKRK